MSRSFGTDLSAVRVNPSSREASEAGAQAVTRGSEIHFAPGHYDPDSNQGRALIGHELTHVVQQAEGRVGGQPLARGGNVNRDAALEREADDMGERAARGDVVRSSALALVPSTGGVAQHKPTQTLDGSDVGKTFDVYIWGDGAAPLRGTYVKPVPDAQSYVFDFPSYGQLEVCHDVEATPVADTTSSTEQRAPGMQLPSTSPGLGASVPDARTQSPGVSGPVPAKPTHDHASSSKPTPARDAKPSAPAIDPKEWKYNGSYWESSKGWMFFPEKPAPKGKKGQPAQLVDDKCAPIRDDRMLEALAALDSQRTPEAPKQRASLFVGMLPPAAKRADYSTPEGIGQVWSPGKQGDGYQNAHAHWLKHAQVGGQHHTATGMSEEHQLAATGSYVQHAYEFKAANDGRKFTQRDPEDSKNVTVYYSADLGTIAVFDHDMGVMRSFYDLNPSVHGAPDNRTWLRRNGANV